MVDSIASINLFFNAFHMSVETRNKLMGDISGRAVQIVKEIAQYLQLVEVEFKGQIKGKLAERDEDDSESDAEEHQDH